jgi:CBS domain containing-hemolysin-like protein
MSYVLLLLAVVFFVLLNGFFVAAEFALVRSRRSRMEQLAEDGVRGAALALKQIDRIDEYLSACQLGITMASLAIGFLGEPAIADLFREITGEPFPHEVTLAISVGIAYLITTALHITIGEQVPKIYAIVHPEPIARRTARGLELFFVVMRPGIAALNGISNSILRLLRTDPRADFDEAQSAEELKLLIAQSAHGGALDPGEAGMLSGVFHLHEQEARQVMTPIPAVVTVDASENVQTALRRCVSSGHTRLVVTEDENTDRIKGIVHANSLARILMNQGPDALIESIVKDAPIVPETKPLDDLLADLQRERATMAVVVDEYGRTEGIVTVEDIVEEVVGEIIDETDPAGGAVRRLANGDWFVRGHVPITDLIDYGIELEADSEAYNSVGGFVFGELGRLPKRGDMVRANGYSLRVEAVRENRVEAVRIRDHEPDSRNGRRRREGDEESVREGG